MSRFVAADERMHAPDPSDEWWNESWFFSWIGADGGPAGFFRLGVLPNQGRAMLWSFVHVDGAWLGVEESRLASEHLDLADGAAYDRWGLRFGWAPTPPLEGGRFTFAGACLARTGDRAGAYVPVAVDLACTATSECVGTGTGRDTSETHPHDRFEQSLVASGTVTVGDRSYVVRGGAHRDRSWGPRDWRVAFTLGDLQGDDRQLYFVGSPAYGVGSGYVRTGREVRHLKWVATDVDYDDEARTIGPAVMTFKDVTFEDEAGAAIRVTLAPLAPSVGFDMAHTTPDGSSWPYWRTLVEARVEGWDEPCRGWFEASRFS